MLAGLLLLGFGGFRASDALGQGRVQVVGYRAVRTRDPWLRRERSTPIDEAGHARERDASVRRGIRINSYPVWVNWDLLLVAQSSVRILHPGRQRCWAPGLVSDRWDSERASGLLDVGRWVLGLRVYAHPAPVRAAAYGPLSYNFDRGEQIGVVSRGDRVPSCFSICSARPRDEGRSQEVCGLADVHSRVYPKLSLELSCP